jgi:uncharacterized peroxidase-related enzyme
MQQINKTDETTVSAETAEMLAAVKSQMGMVPNIISTMANSSATLGSYLGMSGALGSGTLSPKLREQIALTAAGENKCDYCASVHTAVGGQLSIDAEELALNLRGRSSDPRTNEALTLVTEIIENRGHISNDRLNQLRNSGFSEEEILEIFSNTMLNMFTNYFNHMAGTEIDFPVVNTSDLVAA